MTARLTTSLSPVGDVSALALDWQALEARAAGTAYQGWTWVGARLAAAPPDTSIIRVRADDTTVGLAFATPGTVKRGGLIPARLLYLNDVGDPAQDVACVEYNDVLAVAGQEAPVRAAALHALADPAFGNWDGLFVRTATPAVLTAIQAATGLEPLDQALGPSAFIDLAAVRDQGSLAALLSANTRQQISRTRRLYEARGPLRLETARTPEAAQALLDQLIPLHIARWAGTPSPSAFAGGPYAGFVTRLVAAGTARGEVEVVALRAGDTLLGVLLNLLYRGEVLFYLGALVQEADGRLKPGLLIHMMCAEARAAEGFTRYDFLAGDQRYKTQLGQPGPAMRSVLFRKPRLKFQLEDALRTLRQRWRGRAG